MTDHEGHAQHVEESDPDAFATFTVLIVGAIVLTIVVLLVQGLYEKSSRAELQRKEVRQFPEELRALRVAQLERLHQVTWVDEDHGIVTIPIEEAIAGMLRDPNPAAPAVLSPGAAPPAAAPPGGGK